MVPDLRYLLDTHVWIWSLLGDRRLGRRAKKVIAGLRSTERIGLASISLEEAAWHLAHGRIAMIEDTPWENWLRDASTAPQLEILPLTAEVAIASEHFSPAFPRDPADRIIAATADVHRLSLVTADESMRKSGEVDTTW